jgi:hypothetical protein
VNATTVLLALAVAAIWALRLYAAPFGRCPRCHGTGNIKRGNRRPVCPRCKGRKRIQRTGSRTLHQLARRVRTGRQAAARYQREDDS